MKPKKSIQTKKKPKKSIQTKKKPKKSIQKTKKKLIVQLIREMKWFEWACIGALLTLALVLFIFAPEEPFDYVTASQEVCDNLVALSLMDVTPQVTPQVLIYPGLIIPLKVMKEEMIEGNDPTPLVRFVYDIYESSYERGEIIADGIIDNDKESLNVVCSIPTEACYQLPPDFEWCLQANMKVEILYVEWEKWISDKKRLS